MSSWASIIYGRTYEVDFRFIVLPEDFSPEKRDWAEEHIRITTRTAEQLPGNPRWSLLKDDQHCLIGATCMVRELLAPLDETTQALTKDRGGRPLYMFVGYVARKDSDGIFPPLPTYSSLSLGWFKPLYDSVQKRWSVKSYDEASRTVIKSSYELITYTSAPPLLDLDEASYALNQTTIDATCLWPDSPDTRQGLWEIASKIAADSPQTIISLCLGLSNSRDALKGPLLNATALDIEQKELRSKPTPPIDEDPIDSFPNPKEINSPKPSEDQATANSKQKVLQLAGGFVCGLLGSSVFSKVGGPIAGATGFIAGSILGWFMMEWVDESTQGALSRASRGLSENCFSADKSKTAENRQRRYRSRSVGSSSSGNNSFTNTQNGLYGFIEKKEENGPTQTQEDDSTWRL